MLSSLPGPREARALQRDRLANQTLTFFYTLEQAEVFRAWWQDDLEYGGTWFASNWAHPQAAVAVRKFIGQPRWVEFTAYAGWKVEITVEVRGRGELPLNPDPFLVAAFDFETGFEDLVNPGRTIFVAGTFEANTDDFVNGTQSARLSAANYFGLPESIDFGFGTGDFGIELWSLIPDPPGAESIDIVGLNEIFNLYYNSVPSLQNQPLSGVAGNDVTGAARNVFQHHFFGRQDGRMYHSLNGVFDGAPNYFGPSEESEYDVGSSAFIAFGNRNLSGPFFSGSWSVDRIRVYKGLCPYTADFTPSTGIYPD